MLKSLVIAGLIAGDAMVLEAQEYGTWESPVTADLLTKGTIKISEFLVEGDEIYWLESRPEEGGRAVYIRQKDDKEMFSDAFYARSTVHEYGGKTATIRNGILYFVNFKDQFLYKVEEGKDPIIVSNVPNMRYADLSVHPNGKWLYAVGEDHTNYPNIENLLVKIDLETGKLDRIVTGHDFFGGPRISPDGLQLSYYCWDFVNMPWDGTELWIADLDENGIPLSSKLIAGGTDESVISPIWSPENVLYYVSDRSGYWNIYNQLDKCVYKTDAEFASSASVWLVGHVGYCFTEISETPFMVAIMTKNAVDFLVMINLKTQEVTPLDLPHFTSISGVVSYKNGVAFLASGPTTPPQLVSFDLQTKELTQIKCSKELPVSQEFISIPENVEFPTTDGKTAFGFYYAPKNPQYSSGQTDEKPPLIIFSHGGPTANSSSAFNLGIQYWTSRGFAVMDVNYGGSTGFGREYRNRLRYNWGKVDVDDCCNAALYLCEKGLADRNRLAIRGGSAGGYTTLACLAFTDVFKVGANYFGVSDLLGLARHTHKFEARYLDLLVGPVEDKAKYESLSPAFNADRISCPVIIFQGDEDKIVPPEQSDIIYEALMKKKIPTAYLLFEGEQHGFRKAPNIIRSLEAEYFFYCKILGISLPKNIPPVAIENL